LLNKTLRQLSKKQLASPHRHPANKNNYLGKVFNLLGFTRVWWVFQWVFHWILSKRLLCKQWF